MPSENPVPLYARPPHQMMKEKNANYLLLAIITYIVWPCEDTQLSLFDLCGHNGGQTDISASVLKADIPTTTNPVHIRRHDKKIRRINIILHPALATKRTLLAVVLCDHVMQLLMMMTCTRVCGTFGWGMHIVRAKLLMFSESELRAGVRE